MRRRKALKALTDGQVFIHFVCLAAILVLPTPARALDLSLPVDCEINKTCFLQNYVDVDASDQARDYMCGRAAYDGHKGTDFRLISTQDVKQNVAVIAAAPGRVKGIRDGMPDELFDPKNSKSVKGRECGNGVLLDHGEGWETQYCHVKQGSVRVKPGDRVARGERLGFIGFSGQAEFAHLHMSVRHKGRVIDPFTNRSPTKTSCASGAVEPSAGLWRQPVAELLRYRTGQVLEAAFASTVPKDVNSERGFGSLSSPTKESKVFLFLARLINIEPGDQLELVVEGPSGFTVQSKTKPFARAKATYAFYAGKRLKDRAGWPAGRYTGHVKVFRNGQVIDTKQQQIQLR